MQKHSIKKETFSRLHDYGHKGEKHDNLINRLVDICEGEKKEINLSNETVERLKHFGDTIDEALNVLMDRCSVIRR